MPLLCQPKGIMKAVCAATGAVPAQRMMTVGHTGAVPTQRMLKVGPTCAVPAQRMMQTRVHSTESLQLHHTPLHMCVSADDTGRDDEDGTETMDDDNRTNGEVLKHRPSMLYSMMSQPGIMAGQLLTVDSSPVASSTILILLRTCHTTMPCFLELITDQDGQLQCHELYSELYSLNSTL